MRPFKLIKRKNKFIFCRQLESNDCGPACLKMVLDFHGKSYTLSQLRELCKTNRIGTSIFSIVKVANDLGMETAAVEMKAADLTREYPLPSILPWNKNHLVVLVDVVTGRSNSKKFIIADPGFGKVTFNEAEFTRLWAGTDQQGTMIFLSLDENKTAPAVPSVKDRKYEIQYLSKLYAILARNSKNLLLVLSGMILSGIISLAFPLLTQKLVDTGVQHRSYGFITLVLIFQCCLFASLIIIDYFKSWLLLHLGSKIEIQLAFDFLSKVMRLPMYFFDSRSAGDIMQRISDNSRIQNFMKGSLLDFLISVSSMITLSVLILKYDSTIFLSFALLSIFGILWSLYFTRERELLDYRKFEVNTENVDNIFETIVGMPEIKLNNAEKAKISAWKEIQLNMLKINSGILKVHQYQSVGMIGINQLKNIMVTFLAAANVINGTFTLGQMMALSVIIGQINAPMMQLLSFIENLQDAKISFKRLSEIQFKKEEADETITIKGRSTSSLPSFSSINISKLDFSYNEFEDEMLFNNLNLTIPKGQITALVGESGSGKTTLMKLLLRFYDPLQGAIMLDDTDLRTINPEQWRLNCGVVMQDGYIFSDSIAKNIALSSEEVCREQLEFASRMACIHSFISSLPLGYETKVGAKGVGLSAGQKQRILIARAIYKNPSMLFLDEATSSLDTVNERKIQQNLESLFSDKTVFVIAHRLSTVKKAHNIVVLDSGVIVEQGTHSELAGAKGKYFNLVKNQLELGA